MKTLKIGMFAAALLLIFAGCKNAVTPTPYSESEFAKNADEYNNYSSSTMGYDFRVYDSSSSPITVEDNYLDNADDYLVTITFTNKPDKSSLEKGVKFYELSDSEGNKPYLMPKKAGLPSSLIEVRDNNAYFKVTKKDLTYLYGFIDAKIVKAAKGVKLNQDEDQIYGEEHDDSYAFYKQVSGAAPIGNIDFDKKAADLDNYYPYSGMYLNNIFDFNVISAITPIKGDIAGANAFLTEKFEISSTAFHDDYLDSIDLTDKDKDAAYGDMTEILNKHLKIEQYDWKKSEWIDVPVTFTLNKTKTKWETNKVSLEKNRAMRYKIVDADKISITFKNKYGYPIKANLSNTDPTVTTYSLSDSSYRSSLAEGDTWKNTNNVIVNKANGFVTISFTPRLTDEYSVFENSRWYYDVTVAKKSDSTKTLYKGFNKDTITKDSFKCIKNASGANPAKLIAIKSVTVRNSDMDKPACLNEIYIEFEDKTAIADAVYISPDIRTLPFEGSYKGGAEVYNIPAMGFAKSIAPSDDFNTLGGWLKK